MTERGYKDCGSHTERPRDVDTTDEPLQEDDKYLATGYKLLKHWTDGDLKSGKLFRDDEKNPEIMKNTITAISREEGANITDPRVGTSRDHIPVYTRPSRACLGWGGYDKFLSWQEAGRTVHKDMVKYEEDFNDERDGDVDFVNKDGEIVCTVPNIIPKEDLPDYTETAVPLYDLLHGQRRGFQRGPETKEEFITRRHRPLRKD